MTPQESGGRDIMKHIKMQKRSESDGRKLPRPTLFWTTRQRYNARNHFAHREQLALSEIEVGRVFSSRKAAVLPSKRHFMIERERHPPSSFLEGKKKPGYWQHNPVALRVCHDSRELALTYHARSSC